MNNLKGSRIYLSGPMDNCPNRGEEWREWITPILESFGVKILNPLNKKIKGYKHLSEDKVFAENRARLINEGKYEEVSDSMKDVRHIDLRMVDRADALIILLDYSMIMTGTLEELFMANSQKKPCIIMCKQGIKKLPPWLYGTIPFETVFDNWDNLLAYLRKIDSSDPDSIDDGRWLFFED